MRLANVFSTSLKVLSAVTIILLASSQLFGGVLRTITFAGTSFTPNTLNVNVGDTIIWIGNYGFHQIQSTTIPGSAATFGPTVINTSTQPLKYVVTVPGVFNYQCNIHVSMGMIGSFTAATSGVDEPVSNNDASLGINYPNPFAGITVLRYTLKNATQVNLNIFDLNGKAIKQVVNKYQSADTYEVPFDASNLPNGAYICELKCGDAILTRRIILAR
jgi:plastocyanin